MRPLPTAIILVLYCLTAAIFTGCKAEQFGHSFASLDEFEEAFRAGKVSRFMYAPDSESVRVNLMIKKHWFFAWIDEAIKEGIDDWEIRMEKFDYYEHRYQTHAVLEDLLIESLIKPDGVIVAASRNDDLEFRFSYLQKDGRFHLEGGGKILKKRKDPDRLIAVNLWLLSDHMDHVNIEWRFSVEGVPVTRYAQWNTEGSGGWTYPGDEFLELKILATSDKLKIDDVSAFQAGLSGDPEKEYELEIVDEDNHIRVVPKAEQ